MTTFKALEVSQQRDSKNYQMKLIERKFSDLPEGELLIRVHYSSLNFKDALSCKGVPGVTRHYPHTPGVDAAGQIVASNSSAFRQGDKVLVTGFDLGMNTSGGFAEYIRVPAHWAIALPEGLSLKESMVLGTAGLTAALCVQKLQRMGVCTQNQGEVIVTGATGGVGNISIALLYHLGYQVVAATGKKESCDYLHALGANRVIDREVLTEGKDKAMLRPAWAGGIDTVGGDILFNLLKSIRQGGSVACCGMALSPKFSANVFPFILRGVNLLGVDSVEISCQEKASVWTKLAGPWRFDQGRLKIKEVGLNEVGSLVEAMFKGQAQGRVLINLNS